jgi:hypothetical protein
MKRFLDKIWLCGWGATQVFRFDRPDIALGFLGGIGDDLLCTAPIEEWLQRGVKRIWFFTRHPELYSHYDRRVRLIPEDSRYQHLALRLGRAMRPLSYSTYDPATDRDSPLAEHIILAVCRRAKLTGRVRLRPHLKLASAELASASQWTGCVALQTSSLTASVPMMNKQWPTERFQTLAKHLIARGLRCVQIGSASDPPLNDVADLRGRTRLRETAAVLAQARLFVGLAGFLMHLARAVECPSLIVYGGREPPELTGYACNINVTDRPECSPCWQRSRCEFEHDCMEHITAEEIVEAAEEAIARTRGPLPEESAIVQ